MDKHSERLRCTAFDRDDLCHEFQPQLGGGIDPLLPQRHFERHQAVVVRLTNRVKFKSGHMFTPVRYSRVSDKCVCRAAGFGRDKVYVAFDN